MFYWIIQVIHATVLEAQSLPPAKTRNTDHVQIVIVLLGHFLRRRLATQKLDNLRHGIAVCDDEYGRQQTLFEWAYPDIARRCREKKLMYPALSADGQLLENPFTS